MFYYTICFIIQKEIIDIIIDVTGNEKLQHIMKNTFYKIS